MTTRDRMVLIGVVVLAVLGGGWLLAVSPERHQAAAAEAQVQSARQELEGAEAKAASARSAQQRYTAAYRSVVSLGKAVPPFEEVPSLIYELEQVSNQRDVDFNSITAGSSGGAGGGAAAAATTAAAAPAGFTQMPFTFTFKGSFEGLAHLLAQIDGFAVRSTAGQVSVSGRLLTIQGATIDVENGGSSSSAPTDSKASSGSGSGSSSTAGSVPLSATITATAYVLPASQGLTGSAAPVGPSAASASSAAPTPTTPAVVRVTP
jgi:hypothetical protein